jgi:tRNA(adenine34) deaminase
MLASVLPEWVFDDADRSFMVAALDEAAAAADGGEVPVGAVVVRRGEIIARAGNRRARDHDPLGHAELLVLRRAAQHLGDWRMEGCVMYVTLEPCPMCTAACRQARLDLVVWGAADERLGACGSVVDLAEDPRLGPPLAQRGGLEADRCRLLLREFFAKQRRSQ